MIKKFLAMLLVSFLGLSIAHAGYGIDCTKPVLPPTQTVGASVPFTMTCKNNTGATFSSFELFSNELDDLNPGAMITFTITWPHGVTDIRPGDVGTVNGTAVFGGPGDYQFDFSKAYGGETFSGIFCRNGEQPSNCINVMASGSSFINQFIYITSLHFGNPVPITICDASTATGAVSACGDSGFHPSGLSRPGEIVFLTLSSGTYAYVTSYQGPVYQCAVNTTTGLLSACASVTNIPSTNIIGIEFFSTTTGQLHAYLGDGHQNGHVWQCPVDSSTGAFGTCVVASSQQFANGLLLFDIERFNKKTILSLPDGNYGNLRQKVWECEINPTTGKIPNPCADSGAGPVYTGPVSMAFNTTTLGDTFAYIASYLVTEITRCTADANGKVSNCNTFDAFFDAAYNNRVQFEHPAQIAFLKGNTADYFYMPDGVMGLLTQCEVNPNPPFPGSLINCNQTGGFTRPFGVTVWP